MAREKREKRKIVKRPAGLVIPVPAPRPVAPDDPSRRIFQQAAEAERAQHRATELPEYRSTAPAPDAQSTDNTTVTDENRRLPEYRSTGVKARKAASGGRNGDDSAAAGARASSSIPSERFYRKSNATADRLDRVLSPAESKVLDHLFRLTVGFNREHCQVRVATLQERTGYRSDKTVRNALIGLEKKGIITRLTHHNSPLGDEYRVHSNSGTPALSDSGTPVLRYSGTPVEKYSSTPVKITGHLNTIVKDKIDDDAFAEITGVLRESVVELTGRETGVEERARWGELGDLLVTELKIAAARTSNISSVPAFLTEHLRRRLWKTDRARLAAPPEPAGAPAHAAGLSHAEVRRCTDCGGTGFYYPDGYDGGVARCRHEGAPRDDDPAR